MVLGDEDEGGSCEHETETMEVSSVATEEHVETSQAQVGKICSFERNILNFQRMEMDVNSPVHSSWHSDVLGYN